MTETRVRRTLLGLSLAACLAPPAHAQESILALPTVTVTEDAASKAPVGASVKTERARLARVPGGTNLVRPQEEARLATLKDALDHQPGIVIQEFFGATDQPRLNIRGSGIQSNPMNRGVLLLQDGLPLNEADGSFVIGTLEPRDSALISVRRGANALTPGATTLGGELDFQSLTGADERARVRFEAGSFGRIGAQAAGGFQGEMFDGRISFGSDRYDGYRHHSASERQSLRANTGFRTAGGIENRTYLSGTDLDFRIPGVVPKSRIDSDPRGIMGEGNTPQDRLLNYNKRDPHRETGQTRLANRTRWGDDNQRQEFGVYVQNTDDEFANGTSITTTDSATRGLQWQLTGKTQGALGYRLALAWNGSDMDRAMYAANPQTGARMQRFGNFALDAENRNALAGLDFALDKNWTLSGDLKWSGVDRDARNLGTGAALDQRWNYLTPKVGIVWSPAPGLRGFANLSRSHEAPTFWEIVNGSVAANNPASATTELVKLKVQRATTFEVGGQGRLGATAVAPLLDITLYRSEVDDELISSTDENGIKVGTYNYRNGTRHQGIEAGLGGAWPLSAGSALDYRMAWTYSDFRFRGGEFSGKQIAGVPKHLISGEILYRTGNWRFGPNLRWLPQDTPTDHANTSGTEQESYALLGFKVDYRFGSWGFFLQGDNLTDRRYASSYSIRNKATAEQPGYLPGNGRNLSTGLTYAF